MSAKDRAKRSDLSLISFCNYFYKSLSSIPATFIKCRSSPIFNLHFHESESIVWLDFHASCKHGDCRLSVPNASLSFQEASQRVFLK